MKVTVLPHDPAWHELFHSLKAELTNALAEIGFLGIEHIGSTSVPGLAAKPIIDIDVVMEQQLIPIAINALEKKGYSYQGELGIRDRHAFQAPSAEPPARNVYICAAGSTALKNHLAVREILKKDEGLREEYGLAKQEHADIFSYTRGKSVVLQDILAEAGLSKQELLEIENQNLQ